GWPRAGPAFFRSRTFHAPSSRARREKEGAQILGPERALADVARVPARPARLKLVVATRRCEADLSMSNKFKLTAASVKGLAPDWYWDTEDRGFLLIVRERSATFSVQKDVRGRTVRVKIGCYPTWTVEQARKK